MRSVKSHTGLLLAKVTKFSMPWARKALLSDCINGNLLQLQSAPLGVLRTALPRGKRSTLDRNSLAVRQKPNPYGVQLRCLVLSVSLSQGQDKRSATVLDIVPAPHGSERLKNALIINFREYKRIKAHTSIRMAYTGFKELYSILQSTSLISICPSSWSSSPLNS